MLYLIAIPTIIRELDGEKYVTWIVAVYLTTSTATLPLYGKLSDIYGRKPLFIAAQVFFLVGSIACGASDSIMMLIVSRGIQGVYTYVIIIIVIT